MTVGLIPCTLAHAEVLAALHSAAFAGMPDTPWAAESFAALLASPAVEGHLAMTAGDQPVGFLLWQGAVDQAEILTLGVLPETRRQGVAAALLRALIGHLSAGGVTGLFLEVAEENLAAQAFYTRNGFQQVGRRWGYYAPAAPGQSRRDALVLSLEMEEAARSRE